jgi:hypothetical protein
MRSTRNWAISLKINQYEIILEGKTKIKILFERGFRQVD